MKPLKYRQIHLDFHTSEHIPGVGSQFDKKQFQQVLLDGHVDSITLFSKCHHGWAYHPSKANRMHPNLSFNLLGAQLEACKEIGVNAPVYISAGLDEKEVLLHPEWLSRREDQSLSFGKSLLDQAGYHLFCYNTGYLDYLLAQVEEVMQLFNPSGVFLDISAERTCFCTKCISDMMAKGLNPKNHEDMKKHSKAVYHNYCTRVNEVVRKYNPNTNIFHNGGHIIKGRRELVGYDTHLELESLPTGGWGYDHFPMSAAYARTLGVDFLGMTGKFHTTWGEFGGFKHPNALIYETALSLACGAKCSIGDQLHPNGALSPATYRLIGAAYQQVEEREEWVIGAKNHADIAVLSYESMPDFTEGRTVDSDIGACRMLLEGHYLFDVIDCLADLSGYQLIVLPDKIHPDKMLTEKLNDYLASGGRILATGTSGLVEDNFVLPLGVIYKGMCELRPDYMHPQYACINGEAQYIMYGQGIEIDVLGGEVLADRVSSYFNRAPFHFCSHQHTPDNPETARPAAVLTENTAYISWDVFEDYATKGSLHLKELVFAALEHLIGMSRTVQATLPDRGILAYMHQVDRDIVHLLYAHTTVRGKNIEVIEDVVPLYDVAVAVRSSKEPSRVYLAPSGEEIPFLYEDGIITCNVPEIFIHQMVVFE